MRRCTTGAWVLVIGLRVAECAELATGQHRSHKLRVGGRQLRRRVGMGVHPASGTRRGRRRARAEVPWRAVPAGLKLGFEAWLSLRFRSPPASGKVVLGAGCNEERGSGIDRQWPRRIYLGAALMPASCHRRSARVGQLRRRRPALVARTCGQRKTTTTCRRMDAGRVTLSPVAGGIGGATKSSLLMGAVVRARRVVREGLAWLGVA